MTRVAAVDPQVKFSDPEPFVRRYTEHVLPSLSAAKREEALKILRRYYPETLPAEHAEGDVVHPPQAQDP
jgi:hypothetical protein